MRSILTLTIASLIAASALHAGIGRYPPQARAAPAPAQSGYSEDALQSAPVAARQGVPAVVYDQPNACFTDEGYGRYASCDQAGF